jgi:hypothetical protein
MVNMLEWGAVWSYPARVQAIHDKPPFSSTNTKTFSIIALVVSSSYHP